VSATQEQILDSHPFLAGLPEGTTELVAGCSRLVAFEPGQLFVAEGEDADTLYLVHRGRVSVESHQAAGGSRSIGTVGPGHLVGLSWAAPPFRWQFDARALEPVSALAIDVRRLRAELGQHPAIGFALLDRLMERLVGQLQTARLQLLDLHALGDEHTR
jgi:CRP/FNR family transcriptional regulator, cyclic AMP receptor protein